MTTTQRSNPNRWKAERKTSNGFWLFALALAATLSAAAFSLGNWNEAEYVALDIWREQDLSTWGTDNDWRVTYMSNNIIIAPNNFDDGADGVVFISGLAVATESDNEDDCLVLDADDFEWPKATGKLEVPPSWNVSQELLDKLEAERKGGLTITPDGSENLEIVNVWPNLEAEQGETE